MSVTGVVPANRAEILGQVDRLVKSELLQNSESLCKLLRYLADHAIENPGGPLKEYQIATEVFGRPRDFDPRLDSTVRVQTGRLRSKLAEYYNGPGATDPVMVELPRGSYLLHVHHRPESEPAPAPPAVPPPAAPARPDVLRPAPPNVLLWALACICVILTAALVYSLVRPAIVVPSTEQQPPEAFRQFWSDFVDTPERPWVVFSNAEFVGRPETGIRYFNPAQDARDQILDHYTGVGEVIAIHELDRVFALLKHSIRVKRGRLLSLDDAKNNDIIFVGSPSENLPLREIATTQDFVFRNMDDGPRKGDLAVVNVHPKAGEQKVFLGTRGMPMAEDYAVIGLTPGINPALRVMTLAGTTTIGTQAAAEFVCRARNIEDLLARLGGRKDGRVPVFETVLRVKVSKGVPVESSIVALHAR